MLMDSSDCLFLLLLRIPSPVKSSTQTIQTFCMAAVHYGGMGYVGQNCIGREG